MAIDAGAPDQIYQSFVNHGPAIQAALVAGADDLFAGLAVIELVWIIGWSVAHKTDIFDMMIVIIRFAIITGFFYWMMNNWVAMATAIVGTFRIWGNSAVQAAGGTANMSPLDFIHAGMDLGGALWKAMSWRDPATMFALLFCGAVVFFIFGKICAEILLVLVESALASYLGTVLMAFNATDFPRGFGQSPIRYAIAVGFKLMTLQFIAGLCQGIVTGWATAVMAGVTPGWQDIGVMVAVPVVMWTLAQRAPTIAQDLIMGSHMSTNAGIINSAKQIASAIAEAGASAAGIVAGGAGAVGLAGRQMAAMSAAGTAPASAAGRAATVARLTAQNAARAAAADVGKRMTGQYSARHGYAGFRMAADLNKQKK